MTTFALNNLWTYLQGLMLSQSEREWLVGKLSEPGGEGFRRGKGIHCEKNIQSDSHIAKTKMVAHTHCSSSSMEPSRSVESPDRQTARRSYKTAFVS